VERPDDKNSEKKWVRGIKRTIFGFGGRFVVKLRTPGKKKDRTDRGGQERGKAGNKTA